LNVITTTGSIGRGAPVVSVDADVDASLGAPDDPDEAPDEPPDDALMVAGPTFFPHDAA
jgi:hypothetical protein